MNYNYTSIKLIDGKIKAVVNKEAYPNYRHKIFEWEQNHEVFEFANQDEKMKVLDSLNDHDELDNGIEVTCIEIKCESCGYNISDKLKEGAIGCCPDGYYKAWFKEEKEEVIYSSKEDRFAMDFSEWCYCNYRFNQTVNEWQSIRTLKIFTTKQLINEYKITRK